MGPPELIQAAAGGIRYYQNGFNSNTYLFKDYSVSGLAAAGTLFTGNPDLRAKVRLPSLPASNRYLIGNWGPTTSNSDCGCSFILQSSGVLTVQFGEGSTLRAMNSSTLDPERPLQRHHMAMSRVTVTKGTNPSTANFYYSTDDGNTWTRSGPPSPSPARFWRSTRPPGGGQPDPRS